MNLFVAALFTILLGTPSNDIRVRIDLKKNNLKSQNIPQQLEVAGQDLRNGTIDILTNRNYIEQLSAQGFQFEIVETRPARVDEQYLNYNKIEAFILQLAEARPDIVRVFSIGKTLKGHNIYAVRLSTEDNLDQKPAVLFNGMHHAREIMTTEVTTDIIDWLVKHYDDPSTPFVSAWLQSLAIWVVPQLNSDGNDIVWSEDNWWRKNARGDGRGIWGVDLNRNYPFQWGSCKGSSDNKNSDTYHGEFAASEPETQAIMNLAKSQNMMFNISYHSYSEIVIGPYGCQNQFTPETQIVAAVGQSLAQLLKTDDARSSYVYGQAWQLLYPVDGEDISWMYNEINTIPFVIEINSSRQGFQPSYSKWRQSTVERQRAGWQYFLHLASAGPQIRGRMLNASTGAPVNGSVRVEGLRYTNEKPRRAQKGFYQKVLVPGSYSLIFEAEGYERQILQVSVGDAPVDLDVYFHSTQIDLE